MRLGAHDKAAKSNACCVFDTLGNSFLVAVHDFALRMLSLENVDSRGGVSSLVESALLRSNLAST